MENDTRESVRTKVHQLFVELAGARGDVFRGGVPARQANNVLGQALADGMDPLKADEMAFHLVDWETDAAFLVAVMLYPDRFAAEELKAGVDMFMVHVPAHVLSAARLGGYPAKDIFNDAQNEAK